MAFKSNNVGSFEDMGLLKCYSIHEKSLFALKYSLYYKVIGILGKKLYTTFIANLGYKNGFD